MEKVVETGSVDEDRAKLDDKDPYIVEGKTKSLIFGRYPALSFVLGEITRI